MSEKCTVKQSVEVIPCRLLEAVCETGNPPKGKRRGVYVWRLVNFDTGKLSRQFIGVKSGEHTDKGFVFNFCPFCGEDISEPFKKDLEDQNDG